MGSSKKLSYLKCGEQGKVEKILGSGSLKKKLLDMGITPGIDVKVARVAPLGDPVDIMVRGYQLSLRKEEAVFIYVEVNDDKTD